VFVEATFVVPAYVFLMLACIQLIVVAWKLSEVQIGTAQLARDMALAQTQQGGKAPCDDVRGRAVGLGRQIFPQFEVVEAQVNDPDCPADTPIILRITYSAPLFLGTLFPGGANFNYTGEAVFFPEKPRVE